MKSLDEIQNVETYEGNVIYFSYTLRAELQTYHQMFLWDIDNTYLETGIETIRGLLRAFFEGALHKKNIPGTATLCKSLESYWHEKLGATPFPMFFLTSSPPQLAKKIMKKFHSDGLSPKGLFCKDIFKHVKMMEFGQLVQQVGYKLLALLQFRLQLRPHIKQIMWGDDSESDATIYCLYSDICTRRLEGKKLICILKGLKVVGSQIDTILKMQNRVPPNDPVEKIYINLANDTDTEYYIKFGRRCLPTYNSFQTSLDLFQNDHLSHQHVVNVAKDMVRNFKFTRDELEWSLDDLIRRNVLGAESLEEILPVLQENHLIHPQFEPSLEPKKIETENKVSHRVELEGNFEPWVPDYIDYLNDYR